MSKILTSAPLVLAALSVFGVAVSAQSLSARVGPRSEENSSVTREAEPKNDAKAGPDQNSSGNPQKTDSLSPRQTAQLAAKSPAIATSNPSVSPSEVSTNTGTVGGLSAIPPADSALRAERKSNPEAGAVSTTAPVASLPASPAAPPTSIYRIGAGDVLDIRLLNVTNDRQSTLFTVLAGGIIEYPLLANPVSVAGITPDELAFQLTAELRHRGVYDNPQVRVSVRDYSSHAVLVSGLVADPGTKILRREAIPLYVVIAEAQPKPEAGRAVVMSHTNGKITNVDLSDASSMGMLVQQGDVINVVMRPPEFFYVGGEINSPGQKNFHSGITLTQAVLASGGVTKVAGPIVRVSRQAVDGRLVFAEYNLKAIEDGLVADPSLQPGDRIEVSVARIKK